MKYKTHLLLITLFCFTPCVINAQSSNSEYDMVGGWKTIRTEAKLYFYTKEIDGVWWFIDPAGCAFISKGVNHISYTADQCPKLGYSPYQRVTDKKYRFPSVWAKAVAENLHRWNFNTIGAWSSDLMFEQEIPYTLILNIGTQAGGDWQSGAFPDVFSGEFHKAAQRVAKRSCKPRKEDIHLLGYFTDNELAWGQDWRRKQSLLIDYLHFEPDAPGRREAISFLKERYEKIESLNQAWKIEAESFKAIPSSLPDSEARKDDETAFLERIASEYFRVCREAIQEADPNHLILGCRFAGRAREAVLKGMKDHVDVISYNTYNYTPPRDQLDRIYRLTGKPIMVTEFSFKAMDSGLPNTKGAGKPVETQQDRAHHFTSFVTELLNIPYMIGYHWFEYVDEPKEGRFDGENSNYGLVNIKDEPWEILTQEMTQTNSKIEQIHSQASTEKKNK